MGKIYDLFTNKAFDSDAFYDINKNASKYVKRLEKLLKKKYKTLLSVRKEYAGHIEFRFAGKKSDVIKDINRLTKELKKKGVSSAYIWHRGVMKLGDKTVGMIESLTMDVLNAFYREIKKVRR